MTEEERQIQEEANRELLECARYGEDDDLLLLIEQHHADVNYVDSNSGNTALHRAAANGHVKCMKILKDRGALHKKNNEGNYPIHWAAQNGQPQALKFLFDSFEGIDVLEKNNQGRSTLTEAFQSGSTDAIELCLSHSTASEDRLLPDNKNNQEGEMEEQEEREGEEEENDGSERKEGEQKKNEITHEMQFTSTGDVVRVRELPITRADNPFGSEEKPEDDTTGQFVVTSYYFFISFHIILLYKQQQDWESGQLLFCCLVGLFR
jgi:hypothetical protein